MESIKLTGIGLVLGLTTIIPGLSAGTMAIVFNVYDRLIEIITPNVKKIFAAWKFLLPLMIGAVAGILFFSRLVTLLLDNYPIPTYWFFIGLIAGSTPPIYRRARRPGSAFPSAVAVVCGILALGAMAAMAVLNPLEDAVSYTVLTPQLFGMLAASGALAAIALIIPGLSGTFFLLVIGMYRTFVQAVSELNIPLLIPVAIGIVAGLLIGAAFVRFLLAKVPGETYGAVLGLLAGSLIVLYPGIESGAAIVFSAVSLLAGFAISFFSGKQKKSL